MPVHPLSDLVLVRIEPAPASQSPLVIPDAWRTPPLEGRVIAVGPGAVLARGEGRRPPAVAIGEIVTWSHGSGESVPLPDGADGLLLKETAILAVIER